MSKPRFTVDRPPRVHEIARLGGSDSKYTMMWLAAMGHPVKSPSSRVPLIVWHNLTAFRREHGWDLSRVTSLTS